MPVYKIYLIQNIRWIYGYNPKVGVINLNSNNSTTAFYAAGNCGVLYNWTTNKMMILQGHVSYAFIRIIFGA